MSVCKIGLMENFNRSIARSFLGLARNRKVRKHGGRHSINGAIWTITAKLNSGEKTVVNKDELFDLSAST